MPKLLKKIIYLHVNANVANTQYNLRAMLHNLTVLKSPVLTLSTSNMLSTQPHA